MNKHNLTEIESARPVFFKADDGPRGLTVEEIAQAAERKIGQNRIAGCVKKGPIWRVHGITEQDRVRLLGEDCRLALRRRNPVDGKIETYNIPLSSKIH